jgi:FtsZ-binding cell division protein ZapB
MNDNTSYTNGIIEEALTLLSDFLSNPTGKRRHRLIEFMKFYQGEVLRGSVEPCVKIDLTPSFPQGEEVHKLSFHRTIFREEEFADSQAYKHGRLYEEGPKMDVSTQEDPEAIRRAINDLRETERKNRKIKAIKDYIDLLQAKEKKAVDVMALWALPIANLKVMTTELRKARSEASKKARDEWKARHHLEVAA